MERKNLLRLMAITPEKCGDIASALIHGHGKHYELGLLCTEFASTPGTGTSSLLMYDLYEAKRPTLPNWLNPSDVLNGVDSPILEAIEQAGLSTTLMMDRHNWSGSSVFRIHEILLSYARIWQAIFNRIGPDVVFFHDTPHWGFARIVELLAQLQGLPTVVSMETAFQDALLLRIGGVHGVDYRPQPEQQSFVERTPPLSNYMTEGIARQVRSAHSQRHKIGVIDRTAQMIGSGLGRIHRIFYPTDLRVPSTIPQGNESTVGRAIHNLRTASEIKQCHDYYDSASVQTAEIDGDFLLYAMHFQPEATTVPNAGLHWNQLNTAGLLRDALPEGMSFAIKEHHQMFRYTKGWSRVRSRYWYAALSELGTLISLDEPMSSVLANATGVVTATGTVGWEALEAGVPVGVTGSPWYRDHPGVWKLRTRDDIKDFTTGLTRRDVGKTKEHGRLLLKRLVPGTWRDTDGKPMPPQIRDEYVAHVAGAARFALESRSGGLGY